MTTRLPILDEIRIASPCNADWDEMTGDAHVRFCGKCEKNVYNLSSMTRADAEALVREKEGRMCVRFYQRSDGTLLTQDCPVGVEKRRFRERVWNSFRTVAASAALLAGLAGGRARADLCVKGNGKPGATQPRPPLQGHVNPRPPELMGKIAPPPEPTHAKMGEPLPVRQMPLMGDIAAPEIKDAPAKDQPANKDQAGTPKK
jgi:hypothetical protein